MVIRNGAKAGVAGLVGSSKVMLGQVRVRLGQVRKYLLDDSVTLIITIKKKCPQKFTKECPQKFTQKMSAKSQPKGGIHEKFHGNSLILFTKIHH